MNKEFRFCPLCKGVLLQEWIEGRYRKYCSQCKWVSYENPLPVAVAAVINKKGELLIARRNLEPGINKWALPGGFIESNETSERACLRELKEETGIEGWITGLVGVYVQKIRKYGSFLVIGYAVRISKENIFLSNEVKEVKFVNYKDIPRIPFSTHRKIIADVFKTCGRSGDISRG